MLRIGFLPSDFNPMLLMLGEPEDLRALGGALRQFSGDGGVVQLDELAFRAARGTRVTLSNSAGQPGLHAVPDATDAFVWRLDVQRAAAFADAGGDFATAARKA